MHGDIIPTFPFSVKRKIPLETALPRGARIVYTVAACMKNVSYREVIRLVWPLALGMANNAIMQFTDRVFLAKESTASLEAILPASMLAVLFIGFFQSIAAYSGSFVAQYHGAGNPRGCAASCRAGLLLSAAAGLVLALLIPVGRILGDWSGHSPDVLAR